MYCEKCGSALPSDGFVCLKCGCMMTNQQISIQKKINDENKKNNINLSGKFKNNLNRDVVYSQKFDKTYITALLTFLSVFFIIIIICFLIV